MLDQNKHSLDCGTVNQGINRDDFQMWLVERGDYPLLENCLLSSWLNSPIGETTKKKTKNLQSASLLNALQKQDEWFEVISDAANQFHAENGTIPTAAQLWNLLCTQPPKCYAITTDKNKKGEVICLNMAGYKSLSKNAFGKRWARYTTQSQNHQT